MSTTTTVTKTVPTSALAAKIKVRVIKNGFGAEITGLDFANGVTNEAYNYIKDAVNKVRHPYQDVLLVNTRLIDYV